MILFFLYTVLSGLAHEKHATRIRGLGTLLQSRPGNSSHDFGESAPPMLPVLKSSVLRPIISNY